MGFISLLLTISEVPISKICVRESVANSFLPCKDPGPAALSVTQIANISGDTSGESFCQAKVSNNLYQELNLKKKCYSANIAGN